MNVIYLVSTTSIIYDFTKMFVKTQSDTTTKINVRRCAAVLARIRFGNASLLLGDCVLHLSASTKSGAVV